MKLSEFLHPSDIAGDLAGATAEDVLAELCRPVALSSLVELPVLLGALLTREEQASTGIGDGVAIPHGKVPGLPTLHATFGRSRRGIKFRAPDSRRVHLFVALFIPETAPGIHLHALTRIGRVFGSSGFREALMEASDASEMYQLIEAEDARL